MAEKSKRQAPAPIVPDETSELLRFGSSLFESFSASPVSKPDVKEIQLARFGDYMHHFGFTLERDVPKRSIVASTLPQNVPTGTQRMRNAEHIHAPADGDDTVEEAGWGMPAAITEEADARCTAAGSFEGCKRFADIATALTAPFEHVTWRQTAEDCALKKVRCIYSWLCQHVTIALERPAPPEDKTKAAPPAKGSDRRSKTGRLKSTAQVVVENEVPPDPLEVALETRTATPVLIATLYQQMLAHVGIDSLLVDGLLKGLSAEEPVEWWWNMVVVGGRSYLVDIASSTYKGVLRQVAEVVVGADTPNDGRGNKLGAAAAKKEKEKEKKPKKDAVKEPETTPAVPLVNLSLGKGPTILQTRRPVEDFYFCTHPSQFIFTHFPRLLSHTLLVAPPNNVSWDSAPRLTHDFFKFPVQLKSHKRSAVFSVRSTPFYISLINQEPSTTELCCVLYQCTLRELPEDLSEKSPLGPEWVWHQRQESTMTETFTLMVPDAGFYCAVIGARQIRPDPYSASISTESFLPILYYQAKTNFVPVSTSLVPRQHLSPSICRLFSPLTAQVMPGTHPVVVVPTCSNVVAVAVVRKTKQAVPDADVAAGEANAKEVRELDSFLAFAPKDATYNGNVSVRTGDGIELWVLYAAPHRNGVSFHEMITIKEKERPPTPPPPVQPNSKTKRKTIVPVGPSPEELEKDKLHRQLAHGQSFIPFVTGIEVRKFVSKDAAGVIQPQPSAEEERAATLRRLIGVTGELYTEATNAATRSGGAVGTYFYKREKFIFNEVASPA